MYAKAGGGWRPDESSADLDRSAARILAVTRAGRDDHRMRTSTRTAQFEEDGAVPALRIASFCQVETDRGRLQSRWAGRGPKGREVER